MSTGVAMNLDYRNDQYDVELNGSIVATCTPPRWEQFKAVVDGVLSAEGEPVDPIVYAEHHFSVGTMLCLDNDGTQIFVRVVRIVWASPKECGFMTEGEPNWDDLAVEIELRKLQHGDNPVLMGRIFVERVESISAL